MRHLLHHIPVSLRRPRRPGSVGQAGAVVLGAVGLVTLHQKIASLWNASYTQSGEQVTVTNESYNSSIAPSASVTIGFTGSYSSSNAAPAAFAVNGTACTT